MRQSLRVFDFSNLSSDSRYLESVTLNKVSLAFLARCRAIMRMVLKMKKEDHEKSNVNDSDIQRRQLLDKQRNKAKKPEDLDQLEILHEELSTASFIYCRYFTSTQFSDLFPSQRFKRSLYKSAVQSVCRRKVKWIDQAENLFHMYPDLSLLLCMLIFRTSLSFSRTSIDFSGLAKFDSLKLTESHC